MRRSALICSLAFCILLDFSASYGQTPAPIVIQAATPAPATATGPAANVSQDTTQPTLQLLQEMQATNAATIKKQEAALVTLDELQKAAEELKIFSKRG